MMNREQPLHRLKFEDDHPFHEEINAVTAIERNALVVDRAISLPFETKTSEGEFVSERLLVGGLQESGAKFTMHLHAQSNDSMCKLVDTIFILLRVVGIHFR
jgi:hypothetical protein